MWPRYQNRQGLNPWRLGTCCSSCVYFPCAVWCSFGCCSKTCHLPEGRNNVLLNHSPLRFLMRQSLAQCTHTPTQRRSHSWLGFFTSTGTGRVGLPEEDRRRKREKEERTRGGETAEEQGGVCPTVVECCGRPAPCVVRAPQSLPQAGDRCPRQSAPVIGRPSDGLVGGAPSRPQTQTVVAASDGGMKWWSGPPFTRPLPAPRQSPQTQFSFLNPHTISRSIPFFDHLSPSPFVTPTTLH